MPLKEIKIENYTYITILTFTFVRPYSAASVQSCPVILSIPVVVSQNVTNKSCLVRVKSEKYALWFTLRPLESMREG